MPVRYTEDYLTARAANPRTGLISPSVADTPHTHSNHLRQMSDDSSASSKIHTIPRKLCGVGLKSAQSAMWLQDGSSWHQDTRALKMGSPLLSAPRAAATTALDTSYLDNDQFVVKMPSAREPQPYKFPGSSGAQIKAFEHYKHKAKRTSGQGYDHRLIELYQEDDFDPTLQTMPQQRPTLRPVIHPIQDRPQPPPQVVMPKHRSRVTHNDPSPFQRAEQSLSPPRNVSVETAIHHPAAIVPGSPPSRSLSEETTIHHILPETRIPSDATSGAATITTSRAPTHLGQLPRIRLVHPSLAATPSTPTVRKCSLGCSRASDGNVCINPAARRDTTPVMDSSLRDMLHVHDLPSSSKADALEPPSLGQFAESVALMFTVLWQVLQSGLASHEQAFHRLFPQDLTFWEKVMILKSIVVLLAKAVAMFLIVAVMWKTVDVAIQMVKFLFMPLRFLLGIR